MKCLRLANAYLLTLLSAICFSGSLACHDLKIPDGKLMCGPQMACPSPFHCAAGFCYAPGHEPGDGGTGADAGRDGSSNDASNKDAPSNDRPLGDAASGDTAATVDADPSIPAGSVEQGGACSADLHCKGGHCADGVCCDMACEGTCMACSALYTGGTDGVCAPTKAGMNPHVTRDCAAGKPEECGNDGTCDGAGACRLYGSTQVCGMSSCTGAVGAQSFQPVSTCDGKGKCMAPAAQACGQYNCSPTSGCAKPCTTDDMCGAGNYCATEGICRTKQIDGSACAGAKECAHGVCVDGYCCESDCTKKGCFSCARDYTGQPNGQCQPVSKGKTSPRATDCKAADGKTCGLDGTCDGAGACKSFDNSTKCADPTCTGATFTATATCDGAGKCGVGAKTDCGQFQCSLSGCLKNCQQDSDCSAGSYCTGDKTCAVKKTAGTACQATKECASGVCVDGVCCGSPCSQTCYGCSMEKTGKADGTCAPLKAGTSRSATECPAAAMTSCGNDGTCDGAGKCHSWAQGTACAAGVCDTSGYTAAKTCDGAGHCTGAAAVACGAYPCTPATGCAISCSATQPCGGDTYCDAVTAKCASKKNNGASCQSGAECLTGQCAEGFCCNSACAGGCNSCAKTRNGVADGTCSAIPNGQDPRTAGTCTANGCVADAKCDGSGACRKTPKGTSCGGSTCTMSGNTVTYHGPSTCDGSGACAAPTSDDCNGFVCASSTACKTSCATDNDCLSGTHCESGACKADCTSQSSCPANNTCTNKRCTPCGSGMKSCSNNTCAPSTGCCGDTECTGGKTCNTSTHQCGCTGNTKDCNGTCIASTGCCSNSDCKGTGMTCTAQQTCMCANGYHTCSGSSTCYSDATETTKCGPSCTDCTQPNAVAHCGTGSSCANTCNSSSYNLACPSVGGKASCGQWQFSSSVAQEGWQLYTAPSGTSLSLSGGALAVSYSNGAGQEGSLVVVGVQLCAGGQALNLAGKTIYFSLRLSAPAEFGPYAYMQAASSTAFSDGTSSDQMNPTTSWQNYAFHLGSDATSIGAIGLQFTIAGAFNGFLYIDDVSIQG